MQLYEATITEKNRLFPREIRTRLRYNDLGSLPRRGLRLDFRLLAPAMTIIGPESPFLRSAPAIGTDFWQHLQKCLRNLHRDFLATSFLFMSANAS